MRAHMNRRFPTIAVLTVLTFRVLGCGSQTASETDVQNVANAPLLEDFVMTTAPVVVGEQAYGSVYAEDLDGLVGPNPTKVRRPS